MERCGEVKGDNCKVQQGKQCRTEYKEQCRVVKEQVRDMNIISRGLFTPLYC